MLRMTMIVSGERAKDYFRRALSRGEYYRHDQQLDQERLGSWGGRGADRLGLEGEITKTQFERLCDNLHPHTGEKLTPRHKDSRRVGYDCNFHVPKSVSLAAELGNPETGGDRRIVEAMRESVRETMTEMEADVRARVRRNGADTTRVTGNMAWAEFVHFTARPVDGIPDPHLHVHAVAFNATWDNVEERWKAADFGAVKRDAPYFQAAFEARLKSKLTDLGYGIERRGKGWEIAGVHEDLIRGFSRRTEEIERLAKDRGITGAAEKAALGARTRAHKLGTASLAELRRLYAERADPDQLAQLHGIVHAARNGHCPDVNGDRETARALASAIDHLFTRQSVVRDRDLIAAALQRTAGGVTPKRMHAAVAQLQASGGLMRGKWGGEGLLTTPEVFAEEQAMIRLVQEGRGRYLPIARDHVVRDDALSAEQQMAVEHVLNSRDLVTMVRGRSGAGKTRLMREVVDAIESKGVSVQPVTPQAVTAGEVLREDGFSNALTVAKIFNSSDLQQRLKGQVLWLDEAGQLGAPDTARLLKIAQRVGCRVLMTGDTAQHHAVQRGDAMALIEEFAWIKPAELSEIRRQRNAQYREACEDMASGEIEAGYAKLEAMGAIKELETNDRLQQTAEQYMASVRAGLSTLVIAPTHAEGRAATEAIRSQLKEAKQVGSRDVEIERLKPRQLSEDEKADPAMYRTGDVVEFKQNVRGGFRRSDRAVIRQARDGTVTAQRERDGAHVAIPLDQPGRFEVYEPSSLKIAKGDRIRFTQNGRTADGKHQIYNGSIYETKGVNRQGQLKLANGWTVGKGFGHVDYGYCVTSHASQGRTVDHVMVVQSEASAGASNRQQFYVSVTRGRRRVTVLTDDAQALKARVVRDASRVSATKATGQKAIGMPPIGPARDSLRDLSRWMLRENAARENERSEQGTRGREDRGRNQQGRDGHERTRDL